MQKKSSRCSRDNNAMSVRESAMAKGGSEGQPVYNKPARMYKKGAFAFLFGEG